MKRRRLSLQKFFFLTLGFIFLPGCQRSQSTTTPQSTLQQSTVSIPADLQSVVDQLVRAVEAFDIPDILDAYAEDFRSGTGRSKDSIREVFTQLRANHVKLAVEKAEIENITSDAASLRTQLRLRYADHFRDLGEGEVVITDVLQHALRKEVSGWKIYADTRLSTYREGRFGPHPPNVQLDVPNQLPTNLDYVATVTVRREQETEYQVMVGNYVEDPSILPPPDIVTALPEDGVLHANLLPNPQGRGEMVRITVIAASVDGQWIGATTVSKFVPGEQQQEQDEEQELI